MSCCLPPGRILTRAEREAIARLRERRAAGLAPPAVYAAAAPRPDPLVTFYAAAKVSAPVPVPSSARNPKRTKKPRMTAHQLKKEAAARRAKHRVLVGTTAEAEVDGGHVAEGRRESGDTGSGSMEGKGGAHFVHAVKGLALRQMGKGDDGKENESSCGDEESVGKGEGNGGHVLRTHVRKKWDDMWSKLGGHTPKVERFVLKERPEASDFGESNDRYFQELMTGES